MRKTFKPAERLKSRKLIGQLFSRRSASIGQYPLRLIYQPVEEARSDAPVQFTVSVPKRKFPKAAHRNRIRRQVREAWRLNKHRLYAQCPADAPQYAFMLLYVAKEPLPYPEIEQAMQIAIKRFRKKEWGKPTNRKPS
jgi:ribonuclease P protein component